MENYGEWHIDHRRPCASFDLTNEEEQMMAMMGFGGFGSTKGKEIPDNKFGPSKGACDKKFHRKYRQYMNRVGSTMTLGKPK